MVVSKFLSKRLKFIKIIVLIISTILYIIYSIWLVSYIWFDDRSTRYEQLMLIGIWVTILPYYVNFVNKLLNYDKKE
jgi:peptidoglycan biosynthesis protein MviN/MurJ (putative lipid II flippase)